MKKVLLICTVPSLGDYSIGVVAAAINNKEIGCYAYIFLDGNDQRSEGQQLVRYGLLPHQRNRIKFHKLARNKLIRILSGNRYLNLVKSFALQNQIEIIHFITQDVMLYSHLSKFKDFSLYYTVHDLVSHTVKLSLANQVKHYYFRIRKDRMLVKKINNLVTNSSHQKDELLRLYPNKKIFRHQMPSTATPSIKRGTSKVDELKNIDNYVLFFGRIEMYKGLDQLYKAFTTHPDLSPLQLVIAGKGNIYFERDADKENNVLFINRYIKEEEVGDLFSKAELFVLPYYSATQSAVTSIGYYFHVPVVASDINGLRDTVIHEKTGLLYNPDAPNGLVGAIIRLISDQALRQSIKAYIKKTQPFFAIEQIGQEIAGIYLTDTI